MLKDRLILMLLLSAFALVGVACDVPWDREKEDKGPLPDRAFASTSLLRAYYNSHTIPKGMRHIKIPEGDDFDDKHLTIEFQMGAATIEDVRTHLFLMPPDGKSLNDVDLICRCIAPDGTKSGWKPVDAGTSDTFRPQTEVAFLFEFEGIVMPSGTWRIQLRDDVADNDGRCLLRNASLHINRGDDAPLGINIAEETTADIPRYGALPERKGKREPFDPGHFGMKAMLRNDFTFTSTFSVRAIRLRFGLYVQDGVDETVDPSFMIVSPAGNWLASDLPDPQDSVDIGSSKLLLYDFTFGSLPQSLLMNLNGEPSVGTWSVYMVDTGVDSNIAILTSDEADTGAVVAGGAAITMELFGSN